MVKIDFPKSTCTAFLNDKVGWDLQFYLNIKSISDNITAVLVAYLLIYQTQSNLCTGHYQIMRNSLVIITQGVLVSFLIKTSHRNLKNTCKLTTSANLSLSLLLSLFFFFSFHDNFLYFSLLSLHHIMIFPFFNFFS